MSCNPAIGGIAKGTLVREIDALGGHHGRATDRATIQFRMLNRSKGPAVWAPRAQCDRTLYRRAVRSLLEGFPGIELTQGMVTRLLTDGPRVSGVRDGGRGAACARAPSCSPPGRSLRGRSTSARYSDPAGRAGDQPAVDIAQHIDSLGLTAITLQDGTPPRVDGRPWIGLASSARTATALPTASPFMTMRAAASGAVLDHVGWGRSESRSSARTWRNPLCTEGRSADGVRAIVHPSKTRS